MELSIRLGECTVFDIEADKMKRERTASAKRRSERDGKEEEKKEELVRNNKRTRRYPKGTDCSRRNSEKITNDLMCEYTKTNAKIHCEYQR